jgi:hypothetical protein
MHRDLENTISGELCVRIDCSERKLNPQSPRKKGVFSPKKNGEIATGRNRAPRGSKWNEVRRQGQPGGNTSFISINGDPSEMTPRVIGHVDTPPLPQVSNRSWTVRKSGQPKFTAPVFCPEIFGDMKTAL